MTPATVSEILKRHLDGVLPGAKWSSLVNVYINENDRSIRLGMPSYTPFMINGRGPGGRPPMAPIKEWLKGKGLAEELYWAVSTKIMNEGTRGIGEEWLDDAVEEIQNTWFNDLTKEFEAEFMK